MSDEPILKIKASRITGSNRVFPSEIRVYDDRVEEHKPGPLRQRNQGIRFNQVAQVSIRRGIPWATLTIESTGGHMISVGGSRAPTPTGRKPRSRLVSVERWSMTSLTLR